MATQKEYWKQTTKDLKGYNEGLKDQISYQNQLGDLKKKMRTADEREMKVLKDVVDKTKTIFQNRKSITEETLTSVDLHKLERKLIAEGLADQVKFVQKLKEEDRIHKQINRTVNAQAKIYKNIGDSIDGMIRQIPLIGNFLGDVMGVSDIGKEMAEEFKTAIGGGGGLGEFVKNMGGEFGGSFANSLMLHKGAGQHRNFLSRFLFSGPAAALLAVAGLGALVGQGMKSGIESVGVWNTIKRRVFGAGFEGLREAFGNIGQANLSTLMSMRGSRFRFGVDEKSQAKLLSAQVNISGESKKTALNIQKSLMSSAAMRGVLPEDVMQDLANNTEQFSMYAKDGGQNIGEAAIKARQLGISLETVFKISDGILDFQSSIENELKASLLIGRQLNLNEARRLAMAGDMAGLQDEILKQIGSEAELQKMNMIQRKSLAGALGITVTELNKLASGEVEIKNADMKQNTHWMKILTGAMIGLTIAVGGGTAMHYGGRAMAYMRGQPGVAAKVVKSSNFANTKRWVIEGTTRNFIKKETADLAAKKLTQTAGKQVAGKGMTAALGGLAGGPVGWTITAISLLSMMIPIGRAIANNTDKTAENTKKQRDMHTGQFVTSPIIQGIQKTGVTTN